MTKIKYIHCFGTSFTAGGGFEFEGRSMTSMLYDFYKNTDTPLTQYNFSYPGQLQKLLGNNIRVINHGKNGYGNELTFRKLYEIVSDLNFDKNEHIFIIEYAALGRKELWFNPIEDYVITNYWFDYDTLELKNDIGIANSYGYDSVEKSEFLEKYKSIFLDFYKLTLNLNNEEKLLFQNINFFSSFLKQNKLNYFYTTNLFENEIGRNFNFGDGKYFKQSTDFIGFSYDNKLTIKDETKGISNDLHNGYVSNKLVSQTIYNTLIQHNLLKYEKIDIDYQFFKNFKFLNKKII